MRSSLQLLARAALLALIAGVVVFASGCASPVADAQQTTPYPGPTTAATVAPTTAPTTAATTAATTNPYPGPTGAPTTAATTAAGTAVPTARPVATPTRTAPLPNTSGGSLPVFVGLALLALAGVAALARRRA
jgi:LPXTG-motif cell wall-anchored protein